MGEDDDGEAEKGEAEKGEAKKGEAEKGEDNDDGEEVEEKEEDGDGEDSEYKDMGPERIGGIGIEGGRVGTGIAEALERATTADTVNLWMGSDMLLAIC